MSDFVRKEFLRYIYQFVLNKKYEKAEMFINYLIENEEDINLVNWYLDFKKLLYVRPLIICQRVRDYFEEAQENMKYTREKEKLLWEKRVRKKDIFG